MVCVLTIAGLDPGGGAGVAADLRAIARAGAFGCAAVAVMTVQSTAGLRAARAVPAREVVAQAREVLRHQRVGAIKVGALGSDANVRAVARLLAEHAHLPAVIDTPFAATRGTAALLPARALRAVREALLPHAAVLTVNAQEAQAILGARVVTTADARRAARALAGLGARAAVVKGGHVRDRDAVDVVAIGDELHELRARRLRIASPRGTGCTFASLVAGRLAVKPRAPILDALRWAKRVHHAALARARDVGGPAPVLVF